MENNVYMVKLSQNFHQVIFFTYAYKHYHVKGNILHSLNSLQENHHH